MSSRDAGALYLPMHVVFDMCIRRFAQFVLEQFVFRYNCVLILVAEMLPYR